MKTRPARGLQRHPIRLVYLIGQLGLGGSEKQLYLLLKHLDKSQFECHVVVFNASPHYTLEEDLRSHDVFVHPVPDYCGGVLCRMGWLYRLFRRLRPQVVHSWSLHTNPYAGAVGFLTGAPVRLGSARGSLALPEFSRLLLLLRWFMVHSVQSLLVNSATIAQELYAHGISPSRVQVLPNCVETQNPQFGDRNTLWETLPRDGRMIAMVANLSPIKNHLLFVEAIARVIPEFPDLYAVIIGQAIPSTPEYPTCIQARIQEHRLQERLILAGFHPDVPSILPRFYAFCLTSESEGMPNVILEAMAAGLPVVATRVGAVPYLVQHGETGLLVEPGDVDGLVQAFGYLLRHPSEAQAMGAAGRARVQTEFDCQSIVCQLQAYYLGFFR